MEAKKLNFMDCHMKDNEELREIVETLGKQGWRPMICDTPIGISNNSVKCGLPTGIGDENIEDYWWLPKALTDMHLELMIRADGDSMIDAGYEDGDLLRVRFGVTSRDGDNVLAWIDGQCTVKTLFTDEEGMRWLVPQNDSYDAILLKDDMDVRILGVVVGVEKASVRASSRKAMSSILRTKKKLRAARRLSSKQVDELLIKIGEYVLHARQWYAVMRAMADAEVQDENDFDGFCSRVCLLLPQHKHLPDAKELQRMAVLSFAKQVTMWVECDAPVTGKRFRDYMEIAKCMADYLSNEAA